MDPELILYPIIHTTAKSFHLPRFTALDEPSARPGSKCLSVEGAASRVSLGVYLKHAFGTSFRIRGMPGVALARRRLTGQTLPCGWQRLGHWLVAGNTGSLGSRGLGDG